MVRGSHFNMETKTVTYLNSKAWYRALKVIYFIFVGFCYVVAIASIIGFSFFHNWEINLWFSNFPGTRFLVIIIKTLFIPWAIFWAWFVSRVPRWIFYYIYFGSIKPQK